MQRFLLPMELASIQGFDIHESLIPSHRCKSTLAHVLESMTPKDQVLVVGNSVHVPSLTAWMVYVMANIVSVDEFWTIPAVPSQNAGIECLEDAADEVPKPRLKLIWKLNDVECLSS